MTESIHRKSYRLFAATAAGVCSLSIVACSGGNGADAGDALVQGDGTAMTEASIGDGSREGGSDSGADVIRRETGTDAAPDVRDAAPDATADGSPDATPDGSRDATADSRSDAGSDATDGGGADSSDSSTAPTLSFTTPTASQRFGTAGDADTAAAGFQGVTVTLATSAANGSAGTLSVAGGTALTATVTAGALTFTNVTLPEGAAVSLVASVTDATHGTAQATETVNVDLTAPSAATSLSAAIVSRRGGTARLTFTGGSDTTNGTAGSVTSYQVRVSSAPITDATTFAAATVVPFSATPMAPGSTEHVDVSGLRISSDGTQGYYFAVRAVDAAGNTGPIVSTGTALVFAMQQLVIADAAVANFANDVSAGFDINGDSIPDLVVGSYTNAASTSGIARLYFGSHSGAGFSTTMYTQITGTSGLFGYSVSSIGDFNGDGIGDVAVSEPSLSTTVSGTVYIFYGRASWPLTLTTANADVLVTGLPARFNIYQDVRLSHADVNGDALSDLIIGLPSISNNNDVLNPLAHAGAVGILAGRTTGIAPRTYVFPTDAGAIIRGTAAEGFLGGVVAYGGPLIAGQTGDSFLVGGRDAETRGMAYVFAGESLSNFTTEQTTANAAFAFTGGRATEIEERITSVGDLDADGHADLAVGSFVADGYVSLLFGTGSATAPFFTAGPTLHTAAATDFFGIGLAAIQTATTLHPSLFVGSTTADLVAGTGAGGTAAAPTAARLAVFAGRTQAAWSTATADNPDLVIPLAGTPAPVANTVTVIWTPDVDGDGYIDLVTGQLGIDRVIFLY